MMSVRPRSPLLDIALLFLKLGVIGFGGPAAHIALMREEVVRRRRWLSDQEFLDLVSATNLIPGPNSTELAIHIGRRRAGSIGLMVAGAAFILPAAAIVAFIAWTYRRYGTLPEAAGLLYGVKPVVVAIVVQALFALGRSALKRPALVLLGIVALAAALIGVHELAILAIAGVGAALIAWMQSSGASARRASLALAAAVSCGGGSVAAAAGSATAAAVGLWPLFLVFLKAGGLLFGSGYVLLAFLRADLVERLQWMTDAQLLDAIAVGQVTPGPVFTAGTFIGYLLAGMPGAWIATIAIFLPAFALVAGTAPFVDIMRRSPVAAATLDAVNVASLALMAAVTAHLARDAITDPLSAAVALLSGVVLIRYRVNSAWLVLAGAAIGISSVALR